MTSFKHIFLLALLGACLVFAGCGGDDEGEPIPGQTAQALQNELDGVQARIDNGSAGACRDILEGERGPNLERVQELLDQLPDDVDADVRSALEDSFNRLWELVQEDCDEKQQEEEQQREEEPEPAPEPEPEETETETETVPPPEEEEDEEPVPTDPEVAPLPPDGDGDSGGGVPGVGNGSGGVGPGPSKAKREKAK